MAGTTLASGMIEKRIEEILHHYEAGWNQMRTAKELEESADHLGADADLRETELRRHIARIRSDAAREGRHAGIRLHQLSLDEGDAALERFKVRARARFRKRNQAV
jgi:hypothetical protein